MRTLTFILILSMSALLISPAMGKVYITKDDALKKAFPEASEIERLNLFLTDSDMNRIQDISGAKVESKLLTYYKAQGKEGILGYAILGSHIVRTKPEVYMVVINPDGSIRYVEILAFYEPEEYLPPKRWYGQFAGKVLDDNLWHKRGISAMTGATLSANGITQEVRKALAVFQIMILKKGD